jgi:hypothetical protein
MPDRTILIGCDYSGDLDAEALAMTSLGDGIEVAPGAAREGPALVYFVWIAENVALPVAAGVVSSWLYSLLAKTRGAKLTVNRRTTETITREGIQRIVEESLEYDEDGDSSALF